MVGAVDCVETKPEEHKVLMNHCRRHVVTKLRLRTKCVKSILFSFSVTL